MGMAELGHFLRSRLTARLALSAERVQALCSTARPDLAKSRQRIDGHRHSSKQIAEEPYTKWSNS